MNLSYLKKEYDITVNIGYCTNKELLTRLPKEIYVKLICKGKWNNFSKVTTAIKYLAEYFNSWFNKYDVAICYAYQHKVLATLTRNSSKHTLLFVHTNLISSRTEEQRNALINGLKFEKFKAIVCVSDSSKAEVEKLLPNYKGKIFTVYNYIDGNKIKEMSSPDLEKELGELKTELFKLKFSLATHGLDNPMKIKEVKKDIAKINTVLTERKIAEAKA